MIGDSIEAELAAIPRVANWQHAALPKALSVRELDAVLRAFDLSHPTEQRDYAIARCLVDLGLRDHEVTYLGLKDIDWRSGTITIVRNKGKLVQKLPLPAQIGEAIARYLYNGRPQTSTRALFVRHAAPFDEPLTVAGIRNTMNRAFARCGLDNRFCNTLVFRHTTAVNLQKSGASLKEIADLQGHRSLNTTMTYVRVDIESLRAVALPWPGSTI